MVEAVNEDQLDTAMDSLETADFQSSNYNWQTGLIFCLYGVSQ